MGRKVWEQPRRRPIESGQDRPADGKPESFPEDRTTEAGVKGGRKNRDGSMTKGACPKPAKERASGNIT